MKHNTEHVGLDARVVKSSAGRSDPMIELNDAVDRAFSRISKAGDHVDP
jgi:hypothetical protein